MKNDYRKPEIYIKKALVMEHIANIIDVSDEEWEDLEEDGEAEDI